MRRDVTLQRLTSPATRRVQAVGFDGERRTVHVRFGFGACIDEIDLTNGRGLGPLTAWRLADSDLDALRDEAERSGLKLPPKRPITTQPRAPQRAAQPAVDPRQRSLFGGNHV